MKEELTTQKEKILDLLYTGESANDLLVFELIKQMEDKKAYYLPLIYLMLDSFGSEFSENILKFLKPVISSRHRKCIEKIDDLMETGLLHSVFLFFRRINPSFISKPVIVDFFSNSELTELSYFHIKRTGDGMPYFFYFDEGHHSKRTEIFDLYLKEIHTRALILYYFSSKEIEMVFDYVWTNFLSFRSLDLFIKDENTLPKDWSKLNSVSEIKIVGKENCVFGNFDFLNTVSDLRAAYISGVKLSQPDVLIRDYNFRMKIDDVEFTNPKFDHWGPFTFYEQVLLEDRALDYGNFLFVIKKSNLSFAKKKKLFYEKIIQPISRYRLNMFSMEELLSLEDTNHKLAKEIVQLEIKSRKGDLKNGKT